MLRELESLSAELSTTEPLAQLKDCTVAIDAAEYLSRFLYPSPVVEPLLSALGGAPFTMRRQVVDDLERLKSHNITPIFYFDGIDYGLNYAPFEESDKSSVLHAQAWKLYSRQEPEEAVMTFGKSKAFNAKSFSPHFQAILTDRNIEYHVAPYSAWAQMAYLERQGDQFVDAVIGAWEMLVFDVTKVIVKLDTNSETYTWVSKAHLLSFFDVSANTFLDSALLSGSKLLPAYPIIDTNPTRQSSKLKMAIDLLSSYGGSANTFLIQQEGPTRSEEEGGAAPSNTAASSLSYLDRYRRAVMGIKHHCIMTSDGKVEALDSTNAPKDLHTLVGQHLPDELYYYLTEGLVSPRLLNWRTSGEIIEPAPLDGGDSEEYRSLVSQKLNRIRATTLYLVSQPLMRFYIYKDVLQRSWYDRANTRVVYDKSSQDRVPKLITWAIRKSAFSDLTTRAASTYLFNAAECFKDTVFVESSLNFNVEVLLQEKDEIVYNTIWRLFQANEYLDDKHQPNKWGKMLFTILDALKNQPELHEAAVLATELARYGLLNCRNMFPTYSVPPPRANEQDKRNTLLLSRIACLAQLQHDAIGFTGPLSRHLLAFGSMITSVRASLRDLTEAVVVNMFLRSTGDRTVKSYAEIAVALPFSLHHDCSLGIAVQSYLNALIDNPEPRTNEVKESLLEKGATEWFPHSINFPGDIQKAFTLWDAIFLGVKSSPGLIADIADFESANEWLKGLRL